MKKISRNMNSTVHIIKIPPLHRTMQSASRTQNRIVSHKSKDDVPLWQVWFWTNNTLSLYVGHFPNPANKQEHHKILQKRKVQKGTLVKTHAQVARWPRRAKQTCTERTSEDHPGESSVSSALHPSNLDRSAVFPRIREFQYCFFDSENPAITWDISPTCRK